MNTITMSPGWERETPRYKASRDLHPSPKSRHRLEPPFSMTIDSDMWQYATRDIGRGEIVETREWPHPSFTPLNYAAQKVLEFFNSRQKSRLPRSPWFGDQIRLSDGLGGPAPRPQIVKPPRFDMSVSS